MEKKTEVSGQFAAIVNPSPLLISRRGQGWLRKYNLYSLFFTPSTYTLLPRT
ncbi:hypothetical protein ABIB40_001767 [Pedobacter sp. UYP30]